MAEQDQFRYFNIRARGEAIRMLYALAGGSYKEETVTFDEWPTIKADQPLGALPVLVTKDGTLAQSNVIARYVAKKLGLMGCGVWDEALNDLVVETCIEFFGEVLTKIYTWKVLKYVPEPENSAKVMEEVKSNLEKKVAYIQSIAEKRGKNFIICNKMELADVYLYTSLEFCKVAFPDVMELNSWVKQFTAKVESNSNIKKYLASRPTSPPGI